MTICLLIGSFSPDRSVLLKYAVWAVLGELLYTTFIKIRMSNVFRREQAVCIKKQVDVDGLLLLDVLYQHSLPTVECSFIATVLGFEQHIVYKFTSYSFVLSTHDLLFLIFISIKI